MFLLDYFQAHFIFFSKFTPNFKSRNLFSISLMSVTFQNFISFWTDCLFHKLSISSNSRKFGHIFFQSFCMKYISCNTYMYFLYFQFQLDISFKTVFISSVVVVCSLISTNALKRHFDI